MPGDNTKQIATYSILIGVTPLIPVPLVDDIARTYLQRRLVRRLIASAGFQLDEQSVQTLADDRGDGCLWGCVVSITSGLIKRLFRKVFFFLEWKRSIDLVSRSYHHGYLLDVVFSRGWCAPAGPRTPIEVRTAIDEVCRTAPVKPLEHAVKVTFEQSKSLLKRAAGSIGRGARRTIHRSTRAELEMALENAEQQKEREIEPVATRLQQAIAAIPEEHFRRLREELSLRLGIHQDS
ncbi:MAG TPA: hypothetical protein VFV34_17690 [Blastocatellia bacterium]|nr:hypothetical protein [Blastocatellia bacterium]